MMRDWCLEVWGDYACFTRPEMKAERVSYDVITPSAARAIFEAILWKPGLSWNITKIEVINPIRWISVRRNEVGRKVATPTAKQMAGELTTPLGFFIEEERQLRAGLFLREVRYRIYGYFELIEKEKQNHHEAQSEAKYAAMFERRAKNGQCFHRPYLGCREFSGYFKLIEPDEVETKPISLSKDLGYMLYDLDFTEPECPKPMFFRAEMKNGVILTDRRRMEVVK